MIEVLILSISKPLLIGIYKDKQLIKTLSSNEHTSDILAVYVDEIFQEFKDIKAFYYANGPGSYLSVKLVYMFLSSLSIVKNIPFFGALGFYFNNNSPIKAIGNKYFYPSKSKDLYDIKLDVLGDKQVSAFALPQILDSSKFIKNETPLYKLEYLN